MEERERIFYHKIIKIGCLKHIYPWVFDRLFEAEKLTSVLKRTSENKLADIYNYTMKEWNCSMLKFQNCNKLKYIHLCVNMKIFG